MIVIDKIKNWINQDESIHRVAEDLQLTSELILLVRMMFADGVLKPGELDSFKTICKNAFGIPEDKVPQVIEYLQDFGYETSIDDAVAMFEGLDWDRKKTLLVHLLTIAKSDNELHSDEIELIRRTAERLGLNAEDIAQLRKQ